MKLTLKSNLDEFNASLDRFLDKCQNVAPTYFLEQLAGQAQVAGLRKVSERYGVGPRIMEKYVRTRLTRMTATLEARGQGFPIHIFNPRPYGTRKNGGVVARIKGRTIRIKHAFIATMPSSGHVGVFARGGYGGKSKKFIGTGESFGRFQYGKGRLSIGELYTSSPPDAFSDPEVIQAMNDRVEQQAPSVLRQAIRRANL